MAKPEEIKPQHEVKQVDKAAECKGKRNLKSDFGIKRSKHQNLNKDINAVQAYARLPQGKQMGAFAEHQRYRLECRRAKITSSTQDNAYTQNQNATKIYGYAQRHRAGCGRLAFPCCDASHGNLLSPRSAAPNLPSDETTAFMPV